MSEFMERLNELRKKPATAITEGDREFLKARRSYLQPHELAAFGIEEDKPEVAPEATKPSKGLTKVQMQEALTARGIEFAPEATKAHLAALLDEETEDEEDVEDEE